MYEEAHSSFSFCAPLAILAQCFSEGNNLLHPRMLRPRMSSALMLRIYSLIIFFPGKGHRSYCTKLLQLAFVALTDDCGEQ